MKPIKFIICMYFIMSTSTLFLKSQCGDILQYGVHDEKEIYFYQSQFHSLRQLIQKSSSYSQFQSRKLGLTIPIEGVPINGNYADSNWKQWRNSLLKLSYEEFMSITTFHQRIKKANPEIIKAWTTCMNTPGFKAWIIYKNDYKRFQLAIKYVPVPFGTKKSVEIDNITISPTVQVLPAISDDLRVGPERKFYICERDDEKKEIHIAINLRDGISQSLIVAGYEKPEPPPPCSSFNYTGTWTGTHNGFTHILILRQRGCNLTGTLDGYGYHHDYEGPISPTDGVADIKIKRRDPGTCVTVMSAILKIKGNTMTQEVTGTDGKCALSPGYRSRMTYYKK